MQLESRHIDNALILAPNGRIDQAHADSFKAALDPHLSECKTGGTPVLLDFSGVDYISSVGLRVLMLAARQVKAQGGKVVICSLTPLVNEVFEISRFNLVFAVFADVDAALANLSAQ